MARPLTAAELERPSNVTVVSTLAADHAGYSIADERALRALSRAEDRHFWQRSRNGTIARRLARLGLRPPARLLELGCGGGSVAAHLGAAGYDVIGVDGHLPRVVEAARRAPMARFFVHDLSLGTGPLGLGAFDAVALFDVIEHLDDPGAALRDALQRVRRGGLLVGTVPALTLLWSGVDVWSGHRLRYDRHGLSALLAAIPDVEVLEVAYFNRVLVPLLWLQRRWVAAEPDAPRMAESNFRVPPAPINGLLRALLRLEDAVIGRVEAIPGASLWFALRRPVDGGRP